MPGPITRQPGIATHRSRGASAGDLVFAVAIAVGNTDKPMYDQTKAALARIDDSLSFFHTDKSRIVTAVVYIADIDQKNEMNRAWEQWVDPTALPMRACQEGKLEDGYLVEIMVTAVK